MIAYLTRRYRFSASHRLHNVALSASANARLYGKCDSPYGHGHNYALEVTVVGPIDPATGMVYDLVVLDGAVKREVLEPFDTTYLNLDVFAFRGKVPTTENVCIEIFNRLQAKIGNETSRAHLARVRLEETSSNFFEYDGSGPTVGRRRVRR